MKNKLIFACAAVALGGFMMMGLGHLHPYGVPNKPEVDDYYLKYAVPDRSCGNVVTSIVFDYRGYDTLGEASVLFTTVTSIAMLFRKGGKKRS